MDFAEGEMKNKQSSILGKQNLDGQDGHCLRSPFTQTITCALASPIGRLGLYQMRQNSLLATMAFSGHAFSLSSGQDGWTQKSLAKSTLNGKVYLYHSYEPNGDNIKMPMET
jgi:hypothetical protein|tara:strand:+ start:253 stop:588 length:336 start_codon:yes stop_codon:yes gene_type:complete